MGLQIVYITSGNEEESLIIAKALVESKLAACVNILSNVRSVYKWQNEVKNEKEFVLIGKTTSGKNKKLIEKVKEHHSYENPCIVFVDIEGGSKQFLGWVKESMG